MIHVCACSYRENHLWMESQEGMPTFYESISSPLVTSPLKYWWQSLHVSSWLIKLSRQVTDGEAGWLFQSICFIHWIQSNALYIMCARKYIVSNGLLSEEKREKVVIYINIYMQKQKKAPLHCLKCNIWYFLELSIECSSVMIQVIAWYRHWACEEPTIFECSESTLGV